MAYSQEQWDRAKGYYEAGISLSQIKTKTGIARNTISQRAKREQWEHSKNVDYIEAKEIIAIKKGTEREQSILCADEVADERIKHKGIITSLTELNLSKLSEHLTENKKLEKINTGDGMQKFEEVGLGSSDYKNAQDAIDKASITLGVNQRHANSQIQVNNTNAQQNNNITLEDFYTANEA